jgi:hypothetical protein
MLMRRRDDLLLFFSASNNIFIQRECISLWTLYLGYVLICASVHLPPRCVIFYAGERRKMRSHLREILRLPPPARRLQFWHRLLKSIALFRQYFIHSTHAKAPSAAALATWKSNYLLWLCLPLILPHASKQSSRSCSTGSLFLLKNSLVSFK